jgi:hypothetical protein
MREVDHIGFKGRAAVPRAKGSSESAGTENIYMCQF